MAHDGANRHDSKLLAPTLDSVPIERPKPTNKRPQGLCLDRGYDYDSVRELVTGRGFTPHIRTRGEEIKLKLHTPGWRARRWVVEACHSWLNRNRALLIRWAAIGRVCVTVRRWTRSCWCCGRGCSGTR